MLPDFPSRLPAVKVEVPFFPPGFEIVEDALGVEPSKASDTVHTTYMNLSHFEQLVEYGILGPRGAKLLLYPQRPNRSTYSTSPYTYDQMHLWVSEEHILPMGTVANQQLKVPFGKEEELLLPLVKKIEDELLSLVPNPDHDLRRNFIMARLWQRLWYQQVGLEMAYTDEELIRLASHSFYGAAWLELLRVNKPFVEVEVLLGQDLPGAWLLELL